VRGFGCVYLVSCCRYFNQGGSDRVYGCKRFTAIDIRWALNSDIQLKNASLSSPIVDTVVESEGLNNVCVLIDAVSVALTMADTWNASEQLIPSSVRWLSKHALFHNSTSVSDGSGWAADALVPSVGHETWYHLTCHACSQFCVTLGLKLE
jgi:hypothetical protein